MKKTAIRTKQEAYNAYALEMDKSNEAYENRNYPAYAEALRKADELWDLYFYWDEVEDE